MISVAPPILWNPLGGRGQGCDLLLSHHWLWGQGQGWEIWVAQAAEKDGGSSPGVGTEGAATGSAHPGGLPAARDSWGKGRAGRAGLGWAGLVGTFAAGGPELSHGAQRLATSQGSRPGYAVEQALGSTSATALRAGSGAYLLLLCFVDGFNSPKPDF